MTLLSSSKVSKGKFHKTVFNQPKGFINSDIPISIRGIEVRWRIGPAEPVAHVRIETSGEVLLHARNIGPFRQNLHRI